VGRRIPLRRPFVSLMISGGDSPVRSFSEEIEVSGVQVDEDY